MFIQMIEGSTSDPEALHRRLEIWQRDLMPGAVGYLGSAGGCTDSGACVLIARFESAEHARANSDRPEQGEWWRETEACFDGPVTFHDSEDVQVMTHGPMEQAQFIQVMEGHVTDHDRAMALEQASDSMLADARPDLLGSVTAYFDDGEFAMVGYFTSEQEARANEAQEPPAEMASMMSEWQDVMRVDKYLDISQPWLMSR